MSRVVKAFNVNLGETVKIEPKTLERYSQDDSISNSVDLGYLQELEGERALEYANTKAQEILQKAREEAKKIIDEAKVFIEEEREIVLEQAKKNGFEEGYNQAMRHCEDILQEVGMMKQRALEDYKIFLQNVENELVSIIIDVTKKVIASELDLNKEKILHMIKSAFDTCLQKDHVILKVSKNDYEYIVDSKNKLLAMVRGIGEIEIKVDHSLEQGGCILETPYGSVDASINTKLKEIEKVFRGLVSRE